MLEVVGVASGQLKNGLLAEGDQAFFYLNSSDRQARLDPAAHNDDLCIGDRLPIFQIAGLETKAALALLPLRSGIWHFGDVQVSVIRMTSARGAPSVDPELMKEPFILAHVRDFFGPNLLCTKRNLLPAIHSAATAEDGLLVFVAGDGEAGVFGAENDGSFKIMNALPHGYR